MAAPPEASAPQTAPPPAAAETPAAVQLAELEQLRSGVALVAQLRRHNAELQADKAIQQLGARVTPAMRRTLQPLLVHLMAQDAPQTVKLAHSEGSSNAAVEKDVPLVDAFLNVLAAVPSFEALGRGPLATDDGPAADVRTADEVALHAQNGLTPERVAALRAKYQEGN